MSRPRQKAICRSCTVALLACLLALSACGGPGSADNTYTIQYNEKITTDVFSPELSERRSDENYDTMEFTLHPDSGEAEFALHGDTTLTGTLTGDIFPVTSEAGAGYGGVLRGEVTGGGKTYRLMANLICSESDAFMTLTMVRTNKSNLMCVYGELSDEIEAVNRAYREYLSELEAELEQPEQ